MPSEKGSIDPLTNAIFVSDRPIADYVRAALEGKLPHFMLPTFLHEVAHHYCLSGTVGLALACCELEIQRTWSQSPIKLDSPTALLWAQLTSARRVLEPLLEGVAQFAEFDAFPGSSPVMSSVLAWSSFLFARADGMPDADPVQQVRL